MIIYPQYPDISKIDNYGEEKTYNYLKEINLSSNKNEFAIHSQDIAGDRKRLFYEIDFLIFTTKGILVIEVKGSPVSKQNGFYKTGNLSPTRQSPLRQVSINKRKFFDEFLKLNIKEIPESFLIPIVVLCENENKGYPDPHEILGLKKNYTAFKEDIESHSTFKVFLNKAIDHFNTDYLQSKKKMKDIFISDKSLIESKKRLRKEVDFGISATESHGKVLHKLTEEQYKYADASMGFHRVIFEGGAGTGKTFLAVYVAKCWSNQNYKIAFITSSKYSKKILLELLTINYLDNIEIIFSEDLLSNKNFLNKSFDRLIVDEGQQMCNSNYLDIIDKILKGGLAKGIWRWFGDPQFQIIDESLFKEDMYQLLKEYTGNGAITLLQENVRNTDKICNYINLLKLKCGNKSSAISRGFGPEIEFLEPKILMQTVKQVLTKYEQFNSELKVSFLFSFEDDKKNIERLCKTLNVPINYIENDFTKNYLITSIEDYRGLEAELIIIFGLDKIREESLFIKLLYQSFTRSRAYVYLQVENIDGFFEKINKVID